MRVCVCVCVCVWLTWFNNSRAKENGLLENEFPSEILDRSITYTLIPLYLPTYQQGLVCIISKRMAEYKDILV